LGPETRGLRVKLLPAEPYGEVQAIPRICQPPAYSGKLRGLRALPFGLAAVAVFVWWLTEEGGYAPTAWYPGAVVFLVLLGGLIAFSPSVFSPDDQWTRLALVLFAAFTLWTFLSILWAGVRGDAWDGSNRTLLYLTVFSIFALLRWRARDGAVVLALFALGTAIIGTADLVTEGASAFVDGRLAGPTGYANGSAALFLIAFWPAASLAARAEVHWAARSALLATAGLLLQLAILTQSRGAVVAGAIALGTYVVLTPQRLRAVFVLVPVAAVTLASLDPLLSVFASGTEPSLVDAVAREQQALALSTATLVTVGALIALVDRPGGVGRRRHPFVRGRGGLLAAVAVGAVFAALAVGALVTRLSGTPALEDDVGSTSIVGSSRLGAGLESGRFDIWRVAAQTVADHPILGVGADNFAVDFARDRETNEEPLYPHSLVLRAFSQTGLIGGALFLGFVAAALAGAIPRRARSDTLTQAVAVAAVASAVYWLVHGSIDWLWEIPVLAAAAVAFLGMAAGLARRSARAQSVPSRPLGRWAAGVLCVAALGSYLLPGAAAWEVERAVAAWPAAPDRAFSHLDRARRWNPLSERPDVVAGALARRAGQPGEARRAFEEAVGRNPDDWYSLLQLALLNAAEGRNSEAAVQLKRAEELNPLEPTIQEAKRQLLDDELVRGDLVLRLDELAVRSPLGRRSVDCRPALGLASSCS
jgi:O-Antigen ligase/Tetratricopeptide repeat